jgi:hypothetical protein
MNISRLKAAVAAAIARRRRMRTLAKFGLLAGAVLVLDSGAAFADALGTPSMSASLAANPNPISFDGGPLGNIYVGGVVSGFGSWQSNTFNAPGFYDDRDFRWDISNGQVIVQNTTGLFQFYVQAGEYDVLSLGSPIYSANSYTTDTYSALPVAYLKLAPTDTFSIEAGKLPTLIGSEYTFSFQNFNIERGLLWNQEPAISRGVQANYTAGPVVLNLSWNDGYYSNRFNWLSGLATWTIDPANTLAFAGGGNIGSSAPSFPSSYPYIVATPYLQSNSEIFDLMYTHTSGPWTISPYLQYSNVPSAPKIGIFNSADTWGGAVLVNYNINPSWNLAGRVEYIDTSSGQNLLYGPGSKAWSFTVTPTYQYKVFFVRGEASYVTADHTTPFDTAFGNFGTAKDQFRALIETGVVF